MGSVVVDGVDLGGSSYGLILTNPQMEFLPAPRLDIQSLAMADGAVTQGSTFDVRRATLGYAVQGTSGANLLSKLRNIADVLSRTQTGEKTFVFDYMSDRTWYARVEDAWDPTINGMGALGSIALTINPPFAVAAASTNANQALSGVTPATVTNAGKLRVPVSWIIKNGAAEASSGVSIENATTGQTVAGGGILAANEWLRINSEDWTVETSTDSGANWNTAGTNASGTPPDVDAGANTLEIVGIASGTLDWTYTEGYV